jgi:hypothetical protein
MLAAAARHRTTHLTHTRQARRVCFFLHGGCMSKSLFPGGPTAVTPRWRDPGDAPKIRRQVKHDPTQPKRVRPRPEKKWAPNPWREKIADDNELEFRHKNWSGDRQIVRSVLASVDTGAKALSRFDNCGAECLVEWSDSLDRYRLRASYCRCRHCRPCMKAKAALLASNLRNRLAEQPDQGGDRYRFITLTLRHTEAPLHEQIKRLYAHFNVLRKTRFWKQNTRGGAYILEATLNDRGEWHPHLHIFQEGDFLRQHTLANLWMQVTGGSFKVDVKQVKTGKDAAAYVAKYVSKGVADNVWHNRSKAQEWVIATKGLRTCSTFGTWRNFKLLKFDPANAAEDWRPVGLLSRIVADAAAGSIADECLLAALCQVLQYDPTRGYTKQPKPKG